MGPAEWIALAVGCAAVIGSIMGAAFMVGSRLGKVQTEVHALRDEITTAVANNRQEHGWLWDAHNELRNKVYDAD